MTGIAGDPCSGGWGTPSELTRVQPGFPRVRYGKGCTDAVEGRACRQQRTTLDLLDQVKGVLSLLWTDEVRIPNSPLDMVRPDSLRSDYWLLKPDSSSKKEVVKRKTRNPPFWSFRLTVSQQTPCKTGEILSELSPGLQQRTGNRALVQPGLGNWFLGHLKPILAPARGANRIQNMKCGHPVTEPAPTLETDSDGSEVPPRSWELRASIHSRCRGRGKWLTTRASRCVRAHRSPQLRAITGPCQTTLMQELMKLDGNWKNLQLVTIPVFLPITRA
ncbi:hypothetical protein BJX76DRAFT_272488 [Aspergillus varians]